MLNSRIYKSRHVYRITKRKTIICKYSLYNLANVFISFVGSGDAYTVRSFICASENACCRSAHLLQRPQWSATPASLPELTGLMHEKVRCKGRFLFNRITSCLCMVLNGRRILILNWSPVLKVFCS
jgi:hypothetical protein